MSNILFVLLAFFSAWEETQQLIQRGSWNKKDFWIPIWDTNWNGIFKLVDSHHLAFGGFILTMFIMFVGGSTVRLISVPLLGFIPIETAGMITLPANVIILWVVFFYFRNIFMHIIFLKKNRRWWFIIPLLGGLLEKMNIQAIFTGRSIKGK